MPTSPCFKEGVKQLMSGAETDITPCVLDTLWVYSQEEGHNSSAIKSSGKKNLGNGGGGFGLSGATSPSNQPLRTRFTPCTHPCCHLGCPNIKPGKRGGVVANRDSSRRRSSQSRTVGRTDCDQKQHLSNSGSPCQGSCSPPC